MIKLDYFDIFRLCKYAIVSRKHKIFEVKND